MIVKSVKILDNSKAVEGLKQETIDKILEMWGIDLEAESKLELENDPRRIDTGNLRNSITHDRDERFAYIGSNVNYGIFVHEGTRNMAPNRFLKNAVEKNKDRLREMAETEMKNADV